MNEREDEEDGSLREAISMYGTLPVDPQSKVAEGSQGSELVRTQVYLSVEQRDFLREEGQKRGVSMAAALREIINDRMKPAAVNWEGNPLLDDVVVDPEFKSTGKGSLDANASVYGKYES